MLCHRLKDEGKTMTPDAETAVMPSPIGFAEHGFGLIAASNVAGTPS